MNGSMKNRTGLCSLPSRLRVFASLRFKSLRPLSAVGLVLLAACTVTSVRVDKNGNEIPEAPTATPRTGAGATPGPGAGANAGAAVWKWIDSGQFRYRVERRALVPNTGLQLPVASPEGHYVAALSCEEAAALDPDAALTGQTLERTALIIFDVDHPEAPPIDVARNAAWPMWTADGKQLIAVAYDAAHHCGLIIFDLASRQTRRFELELAHVVTPALSPNGKQLALCGFASDPNQARLYLFDLETQRLTPLPAAASPAASGGSPTANPTWQLMPVWLDDHSLASYGVNGTETALFVTSTDGSHPGVPAAKATLPARATDALRDQGGVTGPVSPDRLWWAMYDGEQAQIVLQNLRSGRRVALGANVHAGCWTTGGAGAAGGESRFIFATDKDVAVTLPAGGSRRLWHGVMVPLWCQPGGRTLLMLAPGKEAWTFDLLRAEINPGA